MKVKDCAGCAGCPLARLYPENNFVHARMGKGLRLAIGEAPGEQEAAQDEPFVGGSGSWLRGVKYGDKRRGGFYGKAGARDDDITFANTLACRPPNNDYPTSNDAKYYISKEEGYQAVAHCLKNHLEPLLRGRPWHRVDLIGDKALQFVGQKSEGITQWRGSAIPIPAIDPEKLLAIPTFHPQYVARNQEFIPVVINDLRKTLVIPPEHYTLYPGLDEVKAFTATTFAFDIETVGFTDEIKMVGLCDRAFHVIVVPCRGAYLEELKRIFHNATEVIGHNSIQFDLPKLRRSGICVSDNCQLWDTMLLQHLRFPNLPHDLEFVGSQFSNKPCWKYLKGNNEELYNARDTDVTFQCWLQLKPMIEQAGLMDLYKLVQVPLAKICHLMTETGVQLEPARTKEVRKKLLAEIEVLETQLPKELQPVAYTKRVRKEAPPGTTKTVAKGKGAKKHEIQVPVKFVYVEDTLYEKPWRSSDSKQKYLYKTLGLPEQLKPETEAVTVDKEALDRLASWCKKELDKKILEPELREKYTAVIPLLAVLKRLNKLSTLANGFCRDRCPSCGVALKSENQEICKKCKGEIGGTVLTRIHPSFNVHGTSTGRLSSSGPNFQNQPETARYMYVASHPDWSVIDCDFSQLENRLMAYFAGDLERLMRFDQGVHEHKYATSLFFGIPYAEVVKDNDPEAPYNKAKHVVHGTDRGMGAKKISNKYGVDFKLAKEMQAKWKRAIAKTVDYQERIAREADKNGYLRNQFSRMAWFYTSEAYTESISFMPQSVGADIIFRVMIGLAYERIGWPVELVQKIVQVFEPLPEPANLLVSVHDSLVLEAPDHLVPEVVRIVQKVMSQPWRELGGFSIPVSVKVGKSWGECKDYKL